MAKKTRTRNDHICEVVIIPANENPRLGRCKGCKTENSLLRGYCAACRDERGIFTQAEWDASSSRVESDSPGVGSNPTAAHKSTATAGHQATSEVALPKEAPGASDPSPAPRARTIRYKRNFVLEAKPVAGPTEVEQLQAKLAALEVKYQMALHALDDPLKESMNPVVIVLRECGCPVRSLVDAVEAIQQMAEELRLHRARRHTVETRIKTAAAGGLHGL